MSFVDMKRAIYEKVDRQNIRQGHYETPAQDGTTGEIITAVIDSTPELT
jgi:hypothetical protein